MGRGQKSLHSSPQGGPRKCRPKGAKCRRMPGDESWVPAKITITLCLCTQSEPSLQILSNVSVAGPEEPLASASGVRVSPAPVSHSKSGSYFFRMSKLPCSFLKTCVQCLSSRVPRASNFLCLCIDSNFASAMARICCARQAILRASHGFHFWRMSQLACSFLSRPAPKPQE